MAEDQREQIVERATEQFKRFGIRSVSIDDLCRDMNMSKKTFYIYFRQKDDLVQAVLEYIDRRISTIMVEQYSGKSAEEAVNLFIDGLHEIKEMRNQPPFQYDLQKYYPEIKRRHDQKTYNIVYEHILCHLRKGINEGIYRNDFDAEACAAYVTLTHQQWIAEMYKAQNISKKRLISFFVESLFRSILNEQYFYLVNNIKDIKYED